MFSKLAAHSAKTRLAMVGGQYSAMGFRATQTMNKKVQVGEYVSALETKISGISQVVSSLNLRTTLLSTEKLSLSEMVLLESMD